MAGVPKHRRLEELLRFDYQDELAAEDTPASEGTREESDPLYGQTTSETPFTTADNESASSTRRN